MVGSSCWTTYYFCWGDFMYRTGMGNNIKDMYMAIHNGLVDVGWLVHPIHRDSDGDVDEAVYEGTGAGTDKIYIMLSRYNTSDSIMLDACVGYDTSLGFFEQPGSLHQYLKADGKKNPDIPKFVISNNERYYYWLFIDTYRVIVVCRMSIVYESMYIGFINPIASERQYPYPMYVCGNSHMNGSSWPNNENGSFVFPNNKCGWLRRASGEWRSFVCTKPDPSPSSDGTIFPYNSHNKKLVPSYTETDSVTQNNFLMIPIMLQTNNPQDLSGLLRNCFWISGTRDIDAERILVYDAEQYIVFDTKQDRGANTYFVVKME